MYFLRQNFNISSKLLIIKALFDQVVNELTISDILRQMSKIYNQQVLCFEFNPYLEGINREQREENNKMFEKLKTCWNLRGGLHIDFHIEGVKMAFLAIPNNVLKFHIVRLTI